MSICVMAEKHILSIFRKEVIGDCSAHTKRKITKTTADTSNFFKEGLLKIGRKDRATERHKPSKLRTCAGLYEYRWTADSERSAEVELRRPEKKNGIASRDLGSFLFLLSLEFLRTKRNRGRDGEAPAGVCAGARDQGQAGPTRPRP